MKKFIYILLAAVAFVACSSDEPAPINKGRLDPNAMVRIEAEKGVKIRSTEDASTEDGEELLTALEIAKQGVVIDLVGAFDHNENPYTDGEVHYHSRTFGDNMRDTISENPALLMFSTDIIDDRGKLYKGFLYATDVVVCRANTTWTGKDTIAYIPNSVLKEAREKIEKAYSDSNFTEVYRLFNEAYKFRPITAKQWKKLKAEGKQ